MAIRIVAKGAFDGKVNRAYLTQAPDGEFLPFDQMKALFGLTEEFLLYPIWVSARNEPWARFRVPPNERLWLWAALIPGEDPDLVADYYWGKLKREIERS